MRICSVTMAGPGTEGIIGDALRSVVDWTGECLVIETTGMRENVVAVDKALAVCGAKAGFGYIPWVNDFARMRNAALDRAAQDGCEWAVWLDCDERLVVPDPDLLREELNAQPHTVSALRAWHVDGSYAKERFIRLPRKGEYVGPVHEYWVPAARHEAGWSYACRFDELERDKTSAAWRDKLDRDIRILSEYVTEHRDARWLYYLGDAHSFDDIDKAIGYWEDAVKTDGAGEMRSWAAFRAAMALIERGEAKRALQLALTGIMVYPHGPELFWVAAHACEQLERYHDAIAWAMHAGAAGSYKGWGREVNRTGYVWPPADWYLPYETLASCYARTGAKKLAKLANAEMKQAKAAMTAHFGYAEVA